MSMLGDQHSPSPEQTLIRRIGIDYRHKEEVVEVGSWIGHMCIREGKVGKLPYQEVYVI